MSERKGGAHKVERKSVKMDADSHAELVRYAQSKGIPINIILAEFISKGVKHDIRDPRWIEKLVASQKILNGFAALDRGCHKLAFGKDKDGDGIYFCVAYNAAGVVKTRVLGKTESLMSAKCRSCGLDQDVREGLRQKDERITDLESKIQMRSRVANKVPICNRGAILTQEGTAFRLCPKSSVPVSISGFCKIQSQGLPCALYAEITLAEGPK